MDRKDAPAISKEIFFGVINVLVPDHPGEVVRPSSPGTEVWLNPQPLPPRTGLVQDPWRAVAVARAIVSSAALSMASAQNEDDGMRSARTTLESFVDEMCRTEDRSRVPLPPPWPRIDVRPNALDLVIAAAQLYSASNVLKDHPLSPDLASSAERLLYAALQRLSG